MVDSALAHLVDDAVRSRVEEVLDRVGLDAEEVPKSILDRLAGRTRHPEMRLSVGRYLVVGELGRGGMGVVYEAWDPGIDRGVAIKTIEPELVPEEEREEVIERFKREVKIVGRLHHPAIVTIHDSGLERERDPMTNRRVPTLYYYVMEYLDGRSLARVLRDKRRLSDEVAVAIAADISEALQLSHDAGVIHRDIKPSNIFLRNDTDAVLLDFGIAKTGSVALTRQGQILGTPSYLAPERLREKEVAIDGRADIFSLGVLLFTMLTGEAPFVGEDVYEVIDKIAKASHPKLGRDTPSGQALSRVIDRMLAKNPDDRYATAIEAAIALRHVQSLFELSTASFEIPALAEESGEGETTNPSAPTPMAPVPRPASPGGEDVDTGRLELGIPNDKTAADAPPPVRTEVNRGEHIRGENTIPSDPPPETELLEDAVLDAPPAVATKVTPPPPRTDPNALKVDEPGGKHTVAESEPDDGPGTAVRMADILGTRPELALQRDTRELMPGGDPQIADLIAEELSEPQIEDTSPSLELPVLGKSAAKLEQDTEEREAYEDHAPSNDEATDDETVADPSRRVPSSIRNAPLRAHQAEQDTEQLVRAHRDPKGKRRTKRSSRIEASLVDEDDVVVKPAPLEDLKPDELPTQTGFKIPASNPNAAVMDAGPVAANVVRTRGDSRVPDPAEAAREDEPTRGGAMVAGGREIDLEPGHGPAVELDVPRSAAVARKTFGTARNRGQSRRGPVQVKVSGKPLSSNADERMRLIRRRGIMLLTATLASVAIGLFLGRMKQPAGTESIEIDVAKPNRGAPKVEPRVSAVKRIPGTDQLDLVRPRPPNELIRDAEAARAANHLTDAARLYGSAARAVGEGHELHGPALLGQADALRDQAKNDEAIALYRDVRRLYPRSAEAENAKVALGELGALRTRRVREPSPAAPPPAKRVEVTPPVVNEEVKSPITDDMSPDQKCIAILRNNIDNPRRAVRQLEAMEAKHPRAACVFWHLGRKYENLDDLRAALDAYRRYLELSPRSQRRAAVESKITNLEAKLRQR